MKKQAIRLLALVLAVCSMPFSAWGEGDQKAPLEATPAPTATASPAPQPAETPRPAPEPQPDETPETADEPQATEAPAPTPSLKITEACADNDFVWTLKFEDYLEIHNAGEVAVDLQDYRLQIKKKIVPLPRKTLAPGAYYVLKCDGKTYPSLSKSGFPAAILTADGHEMDSVVVPAGKNQVWLRDKGWSYVPSPGYPNTAAGAAAWYKKNRGSLMISEALCGNYRAAASKERGADMVELYNAGDKSIQLSDYYLSDDKKNLTAYRLPKATLEPGQYYTILCTESVTGFKLSSDGEAIYLTKGKKTVVDALNIPPLQLDMSYGRKGGKTGYFTTPTLGRANATLYASVADAPRISVATSGAHKKSFKVKLTGEGPIYYTTDGSTPTQESSLYEKAITIKSSTTLRAVAMPKGKAPSAVATAVYRFDTGKYTLPCVFVSTDQSCLKDRKYGLLSNPKDKDLEVPAHAAFINADGSGLFSLDCGLSIAGQSNRTGPNRGYKISFRGKYGQSTVDAKAFENSDLTSYDSFVFRLGSTGNPIHDVFGTAIGDGVMKGLLYQNYRFVNLFINGAFYGIYAMREHVNANFIANHLGGNEEDVDMVYCVKDAKLGSNKDWLALVKYCKEHDLSKKEHYNYVAERIDVECFMDYFIWRPYTGDSDHPNIRYVRSRSGPDKRWHINIYDMDWAFQKQEPTMLRYTYRLYEEAKHNNVVIYSLLKNAAFRKAFVKRFAYHMQNTFAPSRVNGILTQLDQQLQHDLPTSQAKRKSSMSAWNRTLSGIRAFISTRLTDRRTVLIQETQKFFKLTDKEMKTYFKGIKY